MVSQQKRYKPAPRTAVKALLYLEENKAEIVIHDDKCYLLSGDKALYLPDKIFDVLVAAEWVTKPRKIDKEHASSVITAAGREKAEAIRTGASKYIQLPMFEVEPENTTRFTDLVSSGRPEKLKGTQLPMFDNSPSGSGRGGR